MIARAIGPYPQVCFPFRMPMVRLVHVLLTLLPLGSCVVYPQAPFVLGNVLCDAAGNGSFGLQVPNVPALVGYELVGQWAVLVAAGPLLGFLDASDALFAIVGG